MAYGEFAKIYDELIYEDINYDEMAQYIIKICNERNIKLDDYLDLACGTGNVTVRLAKNFKNVYAVDLSEDMLREAFEKLRENRIRGKIICQDMSELNLNKKFDLITSVLDSTNYITDDKVLASYFKRVYEHLKDEGLFIFDINSFCPARASMPYSRAMMCFAAAQDCCRSGAWYLWIPKRTEPRCMWR